MSTITAAARNTAVKLPTWAWLAMALALGLLYAVTFDSGFLSSQGRQLEHVPPRALPRRAPPLRRPLPLTADRRSRRSPAMWKRFDPSRPLAVIIGAVVGRHAGRLRRLGAADLHG